jgi:formate dehydrogenase major subunit
MFKSIYTDVLSRWPLARQIAERKDGTGAEAMSDATRALRPRNADVRYARSICPYCAVGCGQRVYYRDNQLLSIEGDPVSPISAGHLCPKGAASFQLLTHPHRLTKVKYRAPRATAWTELDLDTAMDMIADRVWETREHCFEERRDGQALMQCPTIAHLGGATLDNEENYVIKKLFTGGLGMVAVSNQARI